MHQHRRLCTVGGGELGFALAKFALAIGIEQHWQMGKARFFPAQGLPNSQVQWKGGQPFDGADNMRYFHGMVVDDVSEMIGREAVGFEQDSILKPRVVEFDAAADDVFAYGLAGERHLEADDIGSAGRFQLGRFSRRGLAVATVIANPDAAHFLKLFGAGETLVSPSPLDQSMRPCLIQFESL